MNVEKFWEATMPVIKPALHHVTFKTTRLDEMIAWYGTVLGGTINFKDDHNAWMTNDKANHRFAFLSVPGLEDDPDKVKHNVMHHSAFVYETFSDLMSSYARMRDEGIVPAFSLDHGITMSLYYKDPEGNFVELQAITSAIGRDRPSGCERQPILDPIPSGRFSIQRRCIKRTRAASRSRSYSPPSALGGFYRTRSPASACRFPSTRGPQQSDEQHTDCNPKRDRLVARVIKLEVWL